MHKLVLLAPINVAILFENIIINKENTVPIMSNTINAISNIFINANKKI